MKTKYFVLATVIASSCGFSILSAADTPPPPASEGRKPDGPPQGGDPKARMEEVWKRMDTNGDGNITKEEFVSSASKEAGERFAKMDTNGDGSISKAEAEEMAGKMRGMKRDGDARPEGGDGNGARPRPEGDRPRPDNAKPEGDRPRPDDAKPEGFRPRPDGANNQSPPNGDRPEGFRRPGGEGGPPPGGAGMMGEMLMRMDKDGDGSVSKEEYIASNQERFNQMDENKDGKITKDEVEAMARKMRDMMGGGQGGFKRPEGGGEGNGARPRPDGDKPKPRDDA